MKTLRIIAVSVLLVSSAFADPVDLVLRPGLVVLADERFNPAVQRLLAERELDALPIRGGRLFVIVPMTADPAHQQSQIRYLERMLRERQADAQ